MQSRQLLCHHCHANGLSRREILPPGINHLPDMPSKHVCSKHRNERVSKLHCMRSRPAGIKELQRHCQCRVCELHCQDIYERVQPVQLQRVPDVSKGGIRAFDVQFIVQRHMLKLSTRPVHCSNRPNELQQLLCWFFQPKHIIHCLPNLLTRNVCELTRFGQLRYMRRWVLL